MYHGLLSCRLHQRIDAFELWCWRRLENLLDSKEIKLVNPKGNQPWMFIRRTDAEAKVSILWPPHVKSWLIGKDSDAGTDWGQEEKGTTEDEMAGQHRQLNGHEFEQTLGILQFMGSQRVAHDWLNNNKYIYIVFIRFPCCYKPYCIKLSYINIFMGGIVEQFYTSFKICWLSLAVLPKWKYCPKIWPEIYFHQEYIRLCGI